MPGIATNENRVLRAFDLVGDVLVGKFLGKDCLADDLAQILRLHLGCGHSRKGREFIHHAPDVADLPDDGVRALGEDVRFRRDLLEVFSLQAFCGQLYGCQRVFYFMGNAPGNISPGRSALGGDQFGYIIKGHNGTKARIRCPVATMISNLFCLPLGILGAIHLSTEGDTKIVRSQGISPM